VKCRTPGATHGYYFHCLICHSYTLLTEYGNLSKFENQGTESFHQLFSLILMRGVNLSNPDFQILQNILRRFYIPFKNDYKLKSVDGIPKEEVKLSEEMEKLEFLFMHSRANFYNHIKNLIPTVSVIPNEVTISTSDRISLFNSF